MGGIVVRPEPQAHLEDENLPYYEDSDVDPLENLENISIDEDMQSRWRLSKTTKEARKEYEMDGTLPKNATPEYLELREFLNDSKLLRPLGLFAKGYSNVEVLMCWIDIQEFRSIHEDAVDYQRSTALHIFHKYVKVGAACEIPDVDEDLKDMISDVLDDVKDEITDLPVNLYDDIQLKCFQMIHDKIFVQFKKSAYYEAVIADLKTNYNQVVPSDFEYMEKLGQGTFGLVVHVRKKSTGKHYALKVQPKIGLLKCYNDVPHRVDNEKQAIAACSHSFIVSMDYSFQTKSLICMAMDLGTAGTLLDALNSCENNRMNEERVRFYIAEITLALAHLHRMGLIYRDLKPQNVLLTEDGHIKLVDMGGVVDVDGKVMRNCNDIPEEALVLFAPDAPAGGGSMRGLGMSMSSMNSFNDYSSCDRKGGDADDSFSAKSGYKQSSMRGLSLGRGANSEDNTPGSFKRQADAKDDHGSSVASDSSNREGTGTGGGAGGSTGRRPAPLLGQTKRAKSVMGTHGYMAPEVLILLKQKSKDKKGYTNAVDWWSLGITMYKLLTGHLPFPNMNLVAFMNWCTVSKADVALLKEQGVVEIDEVMTAVSGAGNFPDQYISFLRALSTLNRDFHVSSACLDIMLRFLDVVEERRLGYGSMGIKNVKSHTFLNKIQWELLEQRHIIPPYKPIANSTVNRAVHNSLESVLVASGKQDWLTEHPSRAEQKNFKNWNYISPYIVKVEMGMEILMEQYDDPFKNKQLQIMSPPRADLAASSPYFSFRRPSAQNTATSNINPLSPVGLMNSLRRLSNPSVQPQSQAQSQSQSRRASSSSIGTAAVSDMSVRGNQGRERRGSVGSNSGISNANGRRPSIGSNATLNSGRRPSVGSVTAARRGSNVSMMSDGSDAVAALQSATSNSNPRRSSFSKHQQVMRQLSDDTNV